MKWKILGFGCNSTRLMGWFHALLLLFGLIALLFSARIAWCFLFESHNNFGRRRSTDPGRGSTNKYTNAFNTLAVLGSGGHTTEMLHLIKYIMNDDSNDKIILKSIRYVVADTDKTSKAQALAAHVDLLDGFLSFLTLHHRRICRSFHPSIQFDEAEKLDNHSSHHFSQLFMRCFILSLLYSKHLLTL
eukprot:TRINITY_DN3784_c0_g1_i2.p2 TRINITY_DN3784_c0_g1~~TRINITY_DN3784_c0_g1_i2.p2  ORF type:complete len:188 (+),score=32.36 TRINITY_DN3784_c0_g1_i2:387-950(+)